MKTEDSVKYWQIVLKIQGIWMEYASVIMATMMIMECVRYHLPVHPIQHGINKTINASVLMRDNTWSMGDAKGAKSMKYGLRINANANRNIS